MEKYSFVIAIISIMGLTGCTGRTGNSSDDVKTSTEVTLTHISYGNIESKLELMATTSYLKHTSIVAPVAAYITKVDIQQGQMVRRGQKIYALESKEYQALEGIDKSQPRFGKTNVTAPETGCILDVQQQGGSYVPEGTLMATEVNLNSLVYKIDVPYEYSKYVRSGIRCTIVLPDDRHLSAQITSHLISMDAASQSQQVIARARSPFLPEGMNVKVIINKGSHNANMQILPLEAVQSNDDMTEYWIMKLTGKNKAEKIAVTIGNKNGDYIEVKSPRLSADDRIILSGAYALDNGATVKVTK